VAHAFIGQIGDIQDKRRFRRVAGLAFARRLDAAAWTKGGGGRAAGAISTAKK